jgi:hypothetical protein
MWLKFATIALCILATLSHGSSLAVFVFGRGFASERGFSG